jgi:hypothetical protein
MTEESTNVEDLMGVEEEVAVKGEAEVAAAVMEIMGVVVGVREAKEGVEEENQEAKVVNHPEEGAGQCKHLKLVP